MSAKTKASTAEAAHTSAIPRNGPFFRKSSEKTPSIQERLVSGRPGDSYERQADAVADVVTERAHTGDGASVYHKVTPFVSHRASVQAAEEKEPVQAAVEKQREPVDKGGEEEKKENGDVIQAKKEEEAIQARAEEEKQDVQAQVEEPVQAQVEEEPVQAQVGEEEEPVQAQVGEEEEPVQAQVGEEEEPVQAQAGEEEEPVQARLDGSASATSADAVANELRAQRGRGRPLPDDVRRPLEIRFDADFSGIRIHTNDPAVKLTKALRAQAFTRGADIFFNRGRFAPGTGEGDHLLAHELTHTIQQGATPPLQGAERDAEHPAPGATVLQRKEDDPASILVRPELLQAVKIGRGEIGKVNAKMTNPDGTRLGWERLYDYFYTAFGQKEVIHTDVIKYFKKAVDQNGVLKDTMPSWCGIFVWWAYKKAGIPIMDWKLGVPILNQVVQRKPGELPRKGDIAYAEAFQHFGMVTGVESPESAKGKGFKSILVATLNGNTAGDDNLGGQVQEKWDPIGRWLGFFDPVAKLGMPDVPLVATGVEPDTFDPEAEAGAADAAEQEAAADTPPTDVTDLQEDVVATDPDLPAEGQADVPVEPPEPMPAPEPEAEDDLPPLPPTPEPEQVAKVEPLPLKGSSDEAMTSFTDASPSQMAATHPGLGAALDGKIATEQTELSDNPPVLNAELSGNVDEGITSPDQIPVPGDTGIGDGVTGPDPGDLQAKEHKDFGAAPTNEGNEKTLEEKDKEGDFISWLRNNFRGFMSRIRTNDPNVNTNAGERPNVELEGEADPGRIDEQRTDAATAMVGQRDETTEALKNHPGQENIQPVEVHEERTAEITPEKSTSIETTEEASVADYAEAPLSADVRAKSDELLQPNVQANMAAARTQTQQAADKRDDEKENEIRDANEKAAQAGRDADAEQRNVVITNRKEVAQQQKEGIEDAYAHVNDFNKEADKEHTSARKEIGDKVRTAEDGARKELEKGEEDARKEKETKEKEAAEKKRQLEKEQEKQSWWDRVKSAVKSAVKALTSAIDFIFNKLREAVKFIIETAKNLAVKLINAARDWIVDKLNKFRDWAKGMVDKYLKEHFPGLAARINSAIDSVVDTAIDGVNYVADTAIAAVEALAKALAKALDKILSVFQTALKAAVAIAGAVMTGDFAEALRIAIRAACEIAGIDPQPIFDFIDRAAAQIMAILKDPGKFFNNVFSAVGQGVRLFRKNIKKHLIGGLVGWLTGAMSEVAITLPETFDAKGIFSLVMQILGLTFENIKARVIKRFPPAATVFTAIKKGFTLVQRLDTEGPAALWEEAQHALSNLKETVLGAIRSFVITTVIKEAIMWLLGLLNPAGALVKILKLIFDLVMFLIERFEQIKAFVMSVYEALSAIASGAVGKAAAAVEDAMARSLPVVISLLATLAGLSGIGKTVKSIIEKVSKPVRSVVNTIIDKIVAFAKKLLKKGKETAGKVKEALVNWWKARKTFTGDDGETHNLYFKGKGKSATLMFASNPRSYTAFINPIKVADKSEAFKKAKANALATAKKIDALRNKDPKTGKQADEIVPLLNQLAKYTKILTAEEPGTPPSVITYGPVNGEGAGASMNAEILSSKTTKGSAPTDNPKIWQTVGRRKGPSGVAVYVQGHLLNNLLGGPGRAHNLTPITRAANGEHERTIENPVYQLVRAQNKVVKYSVKAIYGSHGTRSVHKKLQQKSTRTNAEEAKLTFLKYEKNNMPTALDCKWQLLRYDKKGKKWVSDTKPSINKGKGTISVHLPDGNFTLQP